MSTQITTVEVAALLALAQDHSFGQPPGSQLRATVIAQHLATAAGLTSTERAHVWWTSTLRFLGCTGHAFDTAVVFGDEIELRAASLHADFSSTAEVLRLMVERAGSDRSGNARIRSVLAVLAGGQKAAELNFRMACEVADSFAQRLGVAEPVRLALAANFERWNGRGLPKHVKGHEIPLAMRVAQLSQELEVFARVDDVARAVEMVADRSGRAYDPVLANLVVANAEEWFAAINDVDPWDAALAVAPPSPPLGAAAARDALLVLADFADLKCPWMSGHSRTVAALALEAGGPDAEAAALVHDFGVVAVPNTIWDKRGPLTRDERDRAESHSLITEQLLRRVPYTAALAGRAGAAHERIDATGYHRRCGAAQLDLTQRVVAAADCYQAMTSERPYRGALTREAAVSEMRAMSRAGQLDGEAVERVLAAAGNRRSARPPLPAGLTTREAEVLRLLTLGLTTREVARELAITAKTADHHVQHIYTKIGVSTRGAAALFAIEHGILPGDT